MAAVPNTPLWKRGGKNGLGLMFVSKLGSNRVNQANTPRPPDLLQSPPSCNIIQASVPETENVTLERGEYVDVNDSDMKVVEETPSYEQ